MNERKEYLNGEGTSMSKDEEILLRELAGGRCTIQKVTDAIGPMSLWSKDGLEAKIRKAVEAEREACAEICDGFYLSWIDIQGRYEFMGEGASECAGAIRARGQA